MLFMSSNRIPWDDDLLIENLRTMTVRIINRFAFIRMTLKALCNDVYISTNSLQCVKGVIALKHAHFPPRTPPLMPMFQLETLRNRMKRNALHSLYDLNDRGVTPCQQSRREPPSGRLMP